MRTNQKCLWDIPLKTQNNFLYSNYLSRTEVRIAGLHCQDDMDNAQVIASLFYFIGNDCLFRTPDLQINLYILLFDYPFYICTNGLLKRLCKFVIVKYFNSFCVQVLCHSLTV